jgi:hypothetical protein
MPCEQEIWLTANRSNSHCPHPAIVHCTQCRAGICSAHIHECEVCEDFICEPCKSEHYRQHELKARQLGRAS